MGCPSELLPRSAVPVNRSRERPFGYGYYTIVMNIYSCQLASLHAWAACMGCMHNASRGLPARALLLKRGTGTEFPGGVDCASR